MGHAMDANATISDTDGLISIGTKIERWKAGENHPQFFRLKQLGGFPNNPGVVGVMVKWLNLYDVNVLDGTFKARFILEVKWFDVKFVSSEYDSLINRVVPVTTCPVLCFENCVALHESAFQMDHLSDGYGKEQEATLRRNGSSDPPGLLMRSGHFTGTFSETFELKHFPFDAQCLTIKIRMWGAGVDSTPDYGRIFVIMDNDLQESIGDNAEWNIHSPLSKTIGKHYEKQALEMILVVQRKPWHYIRTISIPLFFLVSCTFTSVLLDSSSLNDRLAIIFTMLLTVVAFKLVIADKLPKLSYTTDLDSFIDGCFATIFALCIESAVAKHCDIGHGGAYACIVLWSMINIVFFVRFWRFNACISKAIGTPIYNEKPSVRMDSRLEELRQSSSDEEGEEEDDNHSGISEATEMPKEVG